MRQVDPLNRAVRTDQGCPTFLHFRSTFTYYSITISLQQVHFCKLLWNRGVWVFLTQEIFSFKHLISLILSGFLGIHCAFSTSIYGGNVLNFTKIWVLCYFHVCTDGYKGTCLYVEGDQRPDRLAGPIQPLTPTPYFNLTFNIVTAISKTEYTASPGF